MYSAIGSNLKKDIFISLISSAGLGAIIWAMSPVISGAIEPWDAESPYYVVSLFIAGAVVGLLQPKNIWAIYIGIVIGQLIYMAVFLAAGPHWPEVSSNEVMKLGVLLEKEAKNS